MTEHRFLGFTPDGRRRWAADYEALPPIAGGADPSMDDQIDASADDAYEIESPGTMNLTQVYVSLQSSATATERIWGGFRFHNGSFPAQGSTISVAYISVYIFNTTYDDANIDIYGEDGASPATFAATVYNISSRARTSEPTKVPWVADALGAGWVGSPSIVNIIQELVDAYTPTSIALILKPKTDLTKRLFVYSWNEASHVLGAKLHLEWTEGGVITLTPDPVTLPFSVPAPTVSAGAVTLEPSPVAIVTDVPLATIIRTVTLAPDPVTLPLVIAEPSLALGSVVLTPDPVTIPFAVPNHILVGGGAVVLLADPVAIPLVVVDPTLSLGAITLTPDPTAIVLAIPDSQIVAVCTLSPAPVTIPLVVPEPSIAAGISVITPSPAVATWVIPAHVLVAAGAAGFTQFGELTRLIDRSDFPSTALFYFEAIIKTQDPAHTAKARLYNITDGIVVSGSEITTTSTTTQRLRSGALTLPSGAKEYRTEFGGDGGGIYTCHAADVIVDSG